MFEDKKSLIGGKTGFTVLIPVVITIACLLPFVNKAFHIDDPLFLWTAKQIQISPADFYGFNINWYGIDMPISEVAKNPPGTSYYIALITSLFGWDEITLHAAFLIPAAAAAMGTYYLAKRFCARPVLAVLAAILTPGFLVSSTNIMCDTMMLAFWVWAVYLWVRGLDANKYLILFFAAVLIALCSLTKYFGMALLPLLLVYSLVKKRRPGMWVLFLLIPVVILAGYQWVTYNLYGRGFLADAAVYAIGYGGREKLAFFTKGLTGLLFAGGCIITALLYSPLLWSRRILICSVAVMILFIFILSFLEKVGIASTQDENGIRWIFLIQIGLMAAGGVCILVLAGADFLKFRNADSLLLLLWVLGTFIFAAFINWTVNARSILPIAPATGILLMRRIDQYRIDPAQRKRVWRAACPLAPAAAVALLVCWADYTLANSARTAAADIQKAFEDGRQTVWFEGHWGFQYYMETADTKALDFKNLEITKDDIIIIPFTNTNLQQLPPEMVYLSKILKFKASRKIATVNPELGAGFYSEIWGPLPYIFESVEPERYYVFVVR